MSALLTLAQGHALHMSAEQQGSSAAAGCHVIKHLRLQRRMSGITGHIMELQGKQRRELLALCWIWQFMDGGILGSELIQ